MTPTTRRGALRRGLVLLGGLVGVGAAGKGVVADADASLVLYARDLDGHPGGLPRRGDRLMLRGELLDRPDGEPVGELYGTAFALHGPGAQATDAERLELHTFKLRDGTIIGSGAAGVVEGEFAILGGTGRYAGARGTYIARHNRRELGGDGTAEFRLTLTT